MRRSWLIAGALGVVILVAGGIFSKRIIYFLFEKSYPLIFESVLLTRPSEEFGMDLRPNLDRARTVAAGRPHDPRYILSQLRRNEVKRRRIFFVSTSADAFRGDAVPRQKVAGELRIACVGDSITFGWGMDEALSWPGRLRHRLSLSFPQHPTSVINAGIPGFPPDNIPGLIDHKLAPFHPDILIVMRNGNVQWTTPEETYPEVLERILAAANRLGAHLLLALPPTSTFDLRSVNGTYAPMLEAFSRSRGVPMVDFTPLFQEKGTGRGLKLEHLGAHQTLVRWVDAQRTVLVSAVQPSSGVAPAILEWIDKSNESEALFLDEGHPDEEGADLIAEEMLKLLEAQSWMPQNPPRG